MRDFVDTSIVGQWYIFLSLQSSSLPTEPHRDEREYVVKTLSRKALKNSQIIPSGN